VWRGGGLIKLTFFVSNVTDETNKKRQTPIMLFTDDDRFRGFKVGGSDFFSSDKTGRANSRDSHCCHFDYRTFQTVVNGYAVYVIKHLYQYSKCVYITVFLIHVL
jgi:hypothetical protein